MDILKFGYKYYKRHLPLAFLALLMGFGFIGIGLLFPQLSQIIIDFVIIPNDPSANGAVNAGGNIFAFLTDGSYGAKGSMELLLNIVKISVLLMALKHILLYLRNNLYYFYGFKYERTLRVLVYDKLLDSSSFVLSRYNTGDLLTILNNDVVLFRNLFMVTIPTVLDTIYYIILSIVFLFNINPLLAVLPFTVMPFQVFLFIKYIKKARKIHSEIRDASAKLSMNVQENINGVRIVRSFAAEEFEIKKFKVFSSDFKNKYFQQVDFTTRYGFCFNTVRHILYLGCILFGSVLAINGTIGIGAFTAFIAYVFNILDSSINIVNLMYEMQQFIVCGERISTFVNTGNIIDNSPSPKFIDSPPDITVENLSLIIDDHTILKDINLSIPYGKKLGIMGSTASGKTSLLRVLNRFADPVQGSVYINGINLKEIDLDNVRRQYGYVMQDVFLFSNTIDSNIAFYNTDMPREKVINYAELAQAHNFIQRMPAGYDTIVGERGIGLSGGQKQRISVARALAKDAPVLLLDDVTSALDSETEKELLKNIYEKYSNRTIIITAHRVSSVKDCDEIIMLKDGMITERGSHSELMELNGKYAEICRQQSATELGE